MTIEQTLRADQTMAMKSKDKDTLNAIRSVQAEVATAKSAPRFSGEVDDELYTKTIATYVKRISKSKVEYDAMGESGKEQSGKLAFEIDYLSRYIPKVLDENATRALVDKAVADLGASADTPAGKVIGAVMRSGEDLDGALVNRLVREALGS
ncbi:MAG: GatB/YqeY domain-containing protein [Acidimicrobiia bacterium]